MRIAVHARSVFLVFSLVALGGGVAGCHHSSKAGVSATMTQEEQRAMTPDQALARLREGNERYVHGTSLHYDLPAQRGATAHGQHPFAVVHACIDSRSAPELVFDQGIGDLFVPRVAGNYATVDVLGSMEFATKVAGARVVVVLGHTQCGAVKGACDDVQMGNLTTVIQAIRPAVEGVSGVPGEHDSHNPAFVLAATELNVRMTVEKIRADSAILREMERAGEIRIVGAMLDIGTGVVTYLN